MDAERRERAVGVGDLDVHVGRVAGRARVPHGADAERVGHLQQLVLELGDDRIGMAVPDGPELRRLLGDAECLILGPADTDPDDHGRAGEAAAPELGDGVEHRLADPRQSVPVHQHAKVGAEGAALVDRTELDPVRVGLDPVLDVGREHAHVVARIPSSDRVASIGAQRQVPRDAFSGTAHCAFQRHEAAGQHRLVSHDGIDPRHADIGAHGPLILLSDIEILHDRPEHLLGSSSDSRSRIRTNACFTSSGRVVAASRCAS